MTSDCGFELLDHPADMGLKVWALELDSLFEEAGRAVFHVLLDTEKMEGESIKESFEALNPDLNLLMYDWLSELIFLFDADAKVFLSFKVKVDQIEDDMFRLKASFSGDFFDCEKHQVKTYVKAVTLHQLKIEQINGRFEATIYLDI